VIEDTWFTIRNWIGKYLYADKINEWMNKHSNL